MLFGCNLKVVSIIAFSRYLTVQYVRFFWKRESNQKAKILRVMLTIFPFLFCFWIGLGCEYFSLGGFVWLLKINFTMYCDCACLSQKVDYPLELDVYDFCSDDLRKKLEAPRQVSILFWHLNFYNEKMFS